MHHVIERARAFALWLLEDVPVWRLQLLCFFGLLAIDLLQLLFHPPHFLGLVGR